MSFSNPAANLSGLAALNTSIHPWCVFPNTFRIAPIVAKLADSGRFIAGNELSSTVNPAALDGGREVAVVDGRVKDWDAFERLLTYIVVKELGIRRASNDFPFLAALPVSWPPSDVERFVQIAFEILNVPGLLVMDAPLLALYACGLVTGIVVDIGYATTSITPIVDSVVSRGSAVTVPIGGKTVSTYLKMLLESNPAFMQSLKSAGLGLDDALVKALMESGICKLFPQRLRTQPPLISSIKSVEWEYKGVKLPIGAQRHQAFECLFQPSLLGLNIAGIAEQTYTSAMGTLESLEKRFSLWEAVFLTGGVSSVQGLQERFEAELTAFMSASETSNEFQAKDVKFAKIPDYFSAYKDGGAGATFLGGTIVARLTLNSQSQYITKACNNCDSEIVRLTGIYIERLQRDGSVCVSSEINLLKLLPNLKRWGTMLRRRTLALAESRTIRPLVLRGQWRGHAALPGSDAAQKESNAPEVVANELTDRVKLDESLVKSLLENDFTEKQARTIIETVTDAIEESSLQSSHTMVPRAEHDKFVSDTDDSIGKLRMDIRNLSVLDYGALRVELKRIGAGENPTVTEVERMREFVNDNVGSTQGAIRLDVNLEKKRIQSEVDVLEQQVSNAERKIEKEMEFLVGRIERMRREVKTGYTSECELFQYCLRRV
ncbi:hypothetical protein HDU82_002462 [Entophlyctis luteolus]|nr:hypothetical protein HDU82_002462 [Entophlyctis luteolus]